jgi:hypothetical protein
MRTYTFNSFTSDSKRLNKKNINIDRFKNIILNFLDNSYADI